ncbi:TRM11 family SAM-dependent methyltransferase [Evansella tamaricis]|uniref:RsmD family RNA methyltransferase n=1 Tax=Evansella tamaricis TaxID=2069301 RepID=A0ABS6JIR3_9BACI|nr:RsmD family RNA methyltransferase [Evansella tamaricis]MBU9713094.1 RsmD family RNA methyltransferase [Evansella tamaricis]
MQLTSKQQTKYLYTFTFYEEERFLASLELRSLFPDGELLEGNIIQTYRKINPSRSPFIKGRMEILLKRNSLPKMMMDLGELQLEDNSYKIKYIKNPSLSKSEERHLEDRRQIEKQIGLSMYSKQGQVDLHHPDQIYGVICLQNGIWLFGKYKESKAEWHSHQQKPNNYSTALNTRVARAVVNIAVPEPAGIKVIDPCCGIGTVLIEALSMGIKIKGSDVNPLVMSGVRENIAHFGFSAEVKLKDIRDVEGNYDVAIIDMPYNLCSVQDPVVQLEMLRSTRSFAKKMVVITIDSIDDLILKAGFVIHDRCIVKKGKNFQREILVCY